MSAPNIVNDMPLLKQQKYVVMFDEAEDSYFLTSAPGCVEKEITLDQEQLTFLRNQSTCIQLFINTADEEEITLIKSDLLSGPRAVVTGHDFNNIHAYMTFRVMEQTGQSKTNRTWFVLAA